MSDLQTPPTTPRLCRTASTPNRTAAPSPAFLQFWWTDLTRDHFLAATPKADLLSLRLVCRDFGARAAPPLFRELPVTFRPTTFTKPARMAALARVGRHVRTLRFTLAHGPDTFLPPLVDAASGAEVEFLYEPHCPAPITPTTAATAATAAGAAVDAAAAASERLSTPAYGSWELTELLVQQYPPLFHAAANVPAFVRALAALPNLRHLAVACPGQDPADRFRRGVVDYALLSLRIAVERAPLPRLDTLSLLGVHPGAVLYLNPTMGPGVLPSAARRWRQIKALTIHMDCPPPPATDECAPPPPRDHLKLLHAYLQTFAGSLERLTFRWQSASASGGEGGGSSSSDGVAPRGPFPLALSAEPGLEAASPRRACPRRCHLALRPLRFRRLAFCEVDHVLTDASQVATFILAHRRSITEFNFEDTRLRAGGRWDDALAPLTRLSGSERWKDQMHGGGGPGSGGGGGGGGSGGGTGHGAAAGADPGAGKVGLGKAEVMEVPLMLDRPAEPVAEPAHARLARAMLYPRPPRCRTPLLGGLGGLSPGGGPGGEGWGRARERSRGFVEEQVRRLLRNSLLAWAL